MDTFVIGHRRNCVSMTGLKLKAARLPSLNLINLGHVGGVSAIAELRFVMRRSMDAPQWWDTSLCLIALKTSKGRTAWCDSEGKWCQAANALAAQLDLVPLTPIDLERVGQRLMEHLEMLAHHRMTDIFLNWLLPGKRHRLRHLWPRTSWPRVHTSRPRVRGSQFWTPSVAQYPCSSRATGNLAK